MNKCYQCMKDYHETFDICPFCGFEKNANAKEMYYLLPGTKIAERYIVGVAIGSGGFGITYKAWDETLAKIVAIKEYYPAGLVNRVPGEKKIIIYSGSRQREYEKGKFRFLEEAQNMAKFNTHPNIVNVFDFFEENGTAYIIMEYLDGMNYKEYIKKENSKVPYQEAIVVIKAVLSALKEVHKTKILHRDISPDNIFICEDGRIKLIDFGAARFSSTEDIKTRSIILKPGFAPPEQYKTKSKQGPWTDIYAVGATFYRAITGTTPEESVNRLEQDTLIDPKKFCPEISDNLNNLILRSMALQADLRIQSAAEFLQLLDSDSKIKDVDKELKSRKVKRRLSIASIMLASLLAIFVFFNILDQMKVEAGILSETNISIWIPVEDGADPEEEKVDFLKTLDEFTVQYPQVKIDLTVMPRDEYDSKLLSALKENNLPTLFESSTISLEYFDLLEPQSQFFKIVDKDNYYFFNRYDEFFPSKKQIPLTFQMPVIFSNSIMGTEISSTEDLVKNNMLFVTNENFYSFYNLVMQDDSIKNFQVDARIPYQPETKVEVFREENSDYIISQGLESFINQEIPSIMLTTSEYEVVQDNMAGIYEMFIPESNAIGNFTNIFSIAKSSEKEEKDAARQALVYMLSDLGQDVKCVQNDNDLPLNKTAFKTFISINQEFETLSEKFLNLQMLGEFRYTVNRWLENSK